MKSPGEFCWSAWERIRKSAYSQAEAGLTFSSGEQAADRTINKIKYDLEVGNWIKRIIVCKE